MPKKPSYIGLLNAIANGERGGHELFNAWSNSTSDETLQPTLNMIAVREMEHSWAFEKRLTELGFSLRSATNKSLRKHVKLLKSKATDEEKFASFGFGSKDDARSETADALLQILSDKSIDPQTGALMGRFISEERDTGRVLTKAFRAMNARNKKSSLPEPSRRDR
jgi:rubrerythrin